MAKKIDTVNETTEMWRDHRHYLQDRRAERRTEGTLSIITLADAGYTVVWLTDTQARINNVIDLYPTNKRFHVLKTNQRGSYRRETPAQLLKRLKVTSMANQKTCPNCLGSGVDPGDLGPVCGRCGGSGSVK